METKLSNQTPQWVTDALSLPTLKERRKAILDNTIAYYSVNPEDRRSVDKGGACKYSPKTVNKHTSEGCAIGRMLPPDIALRLDDKYRGKAILDLLCTLEIPESIKNLGERFLLELQQLHDLSYNWDIGLSERGKNNVKYIETIL